MSNLQETFDRVQKLKKEAKELKSMYKDALKNSSEYQKICEQINELKGKKKQIEAKVKEEFSSELDKLEVIENEIKNDSQVLSDIAMTKVAKGEKIEVKDEYNNQYEPLFKVNFKKS